MAILKILPLSIARPASTIPLRVQILALLRTKSTGKRLPSSLFEMFMVTENNKSAQSMSLKKSRSVIMPTSFSSFTTGREPMFLSCMIPAA